MTYPPNRKPTHLLLGLAAPLLAFALLLLLPASMYAETWTSTAAPCAGASRTIDSQEYCDWSDSDNWTTPGNAGTAPPSEIGKNEVDTVIINHKVYYDLGTVIKIEADGTLIINTLAGSARADLHIPTNINVENYGKLKMFNSNLTQWRFMDGGTSGTAQSGTFKNEGGSVEMVGARVETAQDWTSSGGVRYVKDSCVLTGQNYSNSGSTDTYIGVCSEFGAHGSGNWQLNSGSAYFEDYLVQLQGSSGDFQIASGTTISSALLKGITYWQGPAGFSVDKDTSGSAYLEAYCTDTILSDEGNKLFGPETQDPHPTCQIAADNSYFPCTDCEADAPDLNVVAACVDINETSVHFTATASGGYTPDGYTYLWDPTTNLDNPTISSPTLTPLPASITTYIVTVQDGVGNQTQGSVKAGPNGCDGDGPLAVGLGYFHATRDGDNVAFIWETATETSNAGFNIYVEDGDGLVMVNEQIIPSTVIDSVVPVRYSYEAAVNGQAFYLDMIDLNLSVDREGPFLQGQEYGVTSSPPDKTDSRLQIFLPFMLH